jgi:hypothetical protein
MNKLIILLVLLPNLALSQAQPFFNYNPSEIKAKRPNADWSYTKWGDNDELFAMGYKDPEAFVMYFFDEDNACVITSITPKTQGDLQAFVESYNKRYVIVSDTEWKFYSEGVVFNCQLAQTKTGIYFFMWTYKL